MQTYEAQVRVTLYIEADNPDAALLFAQQLVQSVLWVKDYHWVRLQEADNESDDKAVGSGVGDVGCSDRVRG